MATALPARGFAWPPLRARSEHVITYDEVIVHSQHRPVLQPIIHDRFSARDCGHHFVVILFPKAEKSV